MFHFPLLFCVYELGWHPSPKAVDPSESKARRVLRGIRCTKIGANSGAPRHAPFFRIPLNQLVVEKSKGPVEPASYEPLMQFENNRSGEGGITSARQRGAR